MRILLIIVIFLNVLRGIGRAMTGFLDAGAEIGIGEKIEMALDAATISFSIAIIATATLFLYKMDLKNNH